MVLDDDDRPACIIPLGKNGQHEAVVSAHHYAALTKWRWNFKVSSWKNGRKVYARRGGGRKSDGTLYPTVLMHAYILEVLMGIPRPFEDATPDHLDGDSLNNTEGNLEWASKSSQSANQKPRAKKQPDTPANDDRPQGRKAA